MNSMKVALKSMRRNLAMTLASIILVFLTVFIGGVIGLLTSNTAYASQNVVNDLNIYARTDVTVSKEESAVIEQKIKENIKVSSIKIVTKEETIQEFANEIYPDNPQSLLDTFGGEKNPLSDEFVITVLDGTELESASKIIEEIEGIKNVSFGDPIATANFINLLKTIAVFSIVLAFILIFISLFIIVNTIKLTITSRKLEIEIMRLVGATKGYIRLPFIYEGIFFGMFGGIGAFIVLFTAYNFLIKYAAAMIGDNVLPSEVVFIPLLIGVVIGSMTMGAIGSFFATSRYLKK